MLNETRSKYAPGAFSASFHESMETAREDWQRPREVEETYCEQKEASFKFDQAQLAYLIRIAPNDREVQRLNRVAQPHAGAWITAVPSDEDGFQTILRPKNFRTAAAYRLGVEVLKGEISCPMCEQSIDKLGDHATCCSKAGDLIVRHNNLRNLVDRIAQDGLLNPVMEKKGILGPTSGRRPGDVSFRLWTHGKGLAIDIAVTCPFTERHVRLEEPCEDYAALQKHAKYDADFEGTDYFFAALVFETTGAINAEGTRVLSQIFRFAASRLGHEFSSYCGRAWARLSCDLQRSVSQAILTRCDGQAGSVRESPRESPVLRESPMVRESPPVRRESPRESPVSGPSSSPLPLVGRGASLAPVIPLFCPLSQRRRPPQSVPPPVHLPAVVSAVVARACLVLVECRAGCLVSVCLVLVRCLVCLVCLVWSSRSERDVCFLFFLSLSVIYRCFVRLCSLET